MADFGTDVSKWVDKAKNALLEESVAIPKFVFKQVVYYSPVKTGRFVGNWQIGSSKPIASLLTKDPSKAKALANIDNIPSNYFLNNASLYLVNNVDYARNIEYDGWRGGATPPQRPVGRAMVDSTGYKPRSV